MKKAIIISIIFLVVFVTASMVITIVTYNQSFPRFERFDESIHGGLRYDDIKDEYSRELFNFESRDNTLQGYLYRQDEPVGLMVIVHGLGGGADSYLTHAKWFLDHGWMVLMYDATGSFDSEGRSTRGFPQSLIDLEAALDYIRDDQTLNQYDLVVFGHSWGGYAALNSLHLSDDIQAVVAVSAPANSLEMTFEQAKKSLGVFTYTQWPFLMFYERILFGRYASFNAVDAVNNSDAHVLVIHGRNDAVVDYQGSAMIAKKDAIINPNTAFITRDLEDRDDHNNLFRSEAAILYLDEINPVYRALYEEHEGNIPYEINQAFYDDVNRELLQELDADLMTAIDSFLKDAIGNTDYRV